MRTKLIFAALALGFAAAVAAGPAMAEGDAKKGKKMFNKCKACHSLKEGKRKVGPSLFGVFGRKAGTLEGFKFSKAMSASGITWDETTLSEFLTKPKKFIPKTKMSFKGLKKEQQRVDLIAYLKASTM